MRRFVIGLTGQTGGGKSTAASVFSAHGYLHLDCDRIAHEVMCAGSACVKELALEFGGGILLPDGNLNRRCLGEIVFGDSQRLERLGQISYPYIRQGIEERFTAGEAAGYRRFLLDAPTLYESGADRQCLAVVALLAPLAERCRRIMARDGLTEAQAMARITAQHEDSYYIRRADYVLYNDSTVQALTHALETCIAEIEQNYALT